MAGELKWKDFVDQGFIVAGSPETVRQQLTHVAKTLRIGHLMVLLQFGSMPPELVRKNTELFAREVLPHLRPTFDEYEDRWWIKPLSEQQRTAPQPVEAAGVPAGGS